MRRVAGGSGGDAWRERSKWVVNDGADGEFDAVIVNIGTCGEPNMVQFPGMPGYKPKEEERGDKKEHEEHEKKGKDEKHGEEKDKPHQDDGAQTEPQAPKKSAWSSPAETKNAVKLKRNQRAKKEQGFPKPDEVHGDASHSSQEPPPEKQDSPPTQDRDITRETTDENITLPDKIGDVHGVTTTTAGGGPSAWDAVEEPTWELGRDQVEKKEQGFPRPEEAYEPGLDLQKDTKRPEEAKHHHDRSDKSDEQKEEKAEGRGGEGEGEVFEKPILHSSQLTSSGMDFRGKTVVVLGGGASAVEAVETALADGAKHAVMVVRDDKVRLSSLSCTFVSRVTDEVLMGMPAVDHPAQRRH